MLFNSIEYLFLFLPLTLLVYFGLSRDKGQPGTSQEFAKLWLVSASLFFYGWWKPEYLVLIVFSLLVNYLLGRLILRARAETYTVFSRPISAKVILIVGVVFNLGLLGYFKYANFIVENFNIVFSRDYGPYNIILPLAISFFTFQQIAYLADCSKDSVTTRYSLLDYALFVSFFPQLIAGPIVHHREMMPQFSSLGHSRYNIENFSKGLFILSIGLFKKLVIADTFAVWASAGFDGTGPLFFYEAWTASLSYTLQLYYDFSGYTDMAIGAALMFNIKLPTNFNSPHKATNIQDFWRRWHMTLSRWLKDYVYIPLGGNRGHRLRTLTNIFLTFLIGGIWHGAQWTFVIWGAMHGAALVIHHLWQKMGWHMHRVPAWILTFLFVDIALVVFRATDMNQAFRVLKGMFGGSGELISAKLAHSMRLLLESPLDFFVATKYLTIYGVFAIPLIVFFGLILVLMPNSMQIINHNTLYSGAFNFRRNIYFAAMAGFSLGVGALLLLSSSSSEFLYFNF